MRKSLFFWYSTLEVEFSINIAEPEEIVGSLDWDSAKTVVYRLKIVNKNIIMDMYFLYFRFDTPCLIKSDI